MLAKKGSIARAWEELRQPQPTISEQLRVLDDNLGEKLFARQGRRLVLTEAGQFVYRYTDEIFALGSELTDVVKGRPRNRPMRLVVGISDLIPKLKAYRILEPAMAMKGGVQIECYEDTPQKLLLSLSAHELDLVLTDAPSYAAARVRLFNHLLGSSGVALFASPKLAHFYRKRFPDSLTAAPSVAGEEFGASPDHGPMVCDAFDPAPNRGGVQDIALLARLQPGGSGHFRCARRG